MSPTVKATHIVCAAGVEEAVEVWAANMGLADFIAEACPPEHVGATTSLLKSEIAGLVLHFAIKVLATQITRDSDNATRRKRNR